MHPNEIKSLKLIEALECGNRQSQRDLAEQLGFSLGLVNTMLKSLVGRGFFNVRASPKGRAKYILTPKGAAEKTVLTYRYILYSLFYYEEIQKRVRFVFSKLKKNNKERIVIYGKNQMSEIASSLIKESNLRLVAIVDGLCQLQLLDYDFIFILELESFAATKKILLEAGIPLDKIVCL